jgi:hypothetical protein
MIHSFIPLLREKFNESEKEFDDQWDFIVIDLDDICVF